MYIKCGLQPGTVLPLKVKMKSMFLTLSAYYMLYILFRKTQSKHGGRNSLTCCHTSIFGLIKPTSTGRLEKKGILLTWCQGLNSVGSASKRQPPQRACSIYAVLPTPHPPHPHTLNSTVWTPLSNLFTLGVLSTKKMSFSASAIVATTWALGRESCQDWDCLEEILKDDSPPSSWHFIQPPVHHLQLCYNAITQHIPLKLRRCEASGRNWGNV